jgi:cytochrome b involved in lipid metabolism
MKEINIEEVKNHDNENDCWLIIGEYVFDLTKFLNYHPGGRRLLLKSAGKDATKEFLEYHKKELLEKYIEKFCVGKINTKNNLLKTKFTNSRNYFGELVPHGDAPWYQGCFRYL